MRTVLGELEKTILILQLVLGEGGPATHGMRLKVEWAKACT